MEIFERDDFVDSMYKVYKKYLDGFDYRKQKTIEKCLERETEKDTYGDHCMFNLYMGEKLEETNKYLESLGEWYEHRKARSPGNPQLEIDFGAMRLIRILHYCDKNLTDTAACSCGICFSKNSG